MEWADIRIIRIVITIFYLVAVFALGLGVARIEFASDTYVFYNKNSEQLNNRHDLRNRFSSSDFIVLAAKSEKPFWTSRGIHDLVQLTEAAWQIPYVTRVDSVVNQPLLGFGLITSR